MHLCLPKPRKAKKEKNISRIAQVFVYVSSIHSITSQIQRIRHFELTMSCISQGVDFIACLIIAKKKHERHVSAPFKVDRSVSFTREASLFPVFFALFFAVFSYLINRYLRVMNDSYRT